MSHPPRILIAEDEPLLAQHLSQLLAQIWPDSTPCLLAKDGEDALAQALTYLPEVLFLDIQMPGLTGLDVPEQLLDVWPSTHPFPLIVYVTAYDQYAIAAFERAAVDYLLKPVTAARLAQTVGRLQERLANRQQDNFPAWLPELQAYLQSPPTTQPYLNYLPISIGKQTRVVPIEQVLYFEAADKYVRVLTAHEEGLIRTPLKVLLPQLNPQQFWQIHRGIIVQAAAIHHVERLEDGKLQLHLHQSTAKLPISRLYAEKFRAL